MEYNERAISNGILSGLHNFDESKLKLEWKLSGTLAKVHDKDVRNTTFQDEGRKNLYHIGIPFSGAMDNRNYLLANKLVGNKLGAPVKEFAYQGPL